MTQINGVNDVARSKRARFIVVLEGAAGVNTIHQLKHLIKLFLRHGGLRCIDAREINCSDDSRIGGQR